ncbi:unnamed protein product [Didymodactylos carnosus]|uniref:Uncharacterized protein n=1 Tax=Didymodactylos carnosus TaxID=1234261 RepID=A0A815R2W3_9BILA|nr:unnamed protein product [Didymodactylos carnosus]CAF1471386.1 unnamed protein product [Didymodactylos carnosus]CAF4091470.1 unnamed protein product [Didymodactylos carnosus]CAF4338986.1 unnamed protein product [Didymodactylos carnosus]
MNSPDTPSSSWTGNWSGSLKTYPLNVTGSGWNVAMEIGPYPTTDGECTIWRTTYSENGTLQALKAYRLCRGRGADDLYIDEDNDVKIKAQWINNALVSAFKYKGVILFTNMRMLGDILEEEMLTVDDKPAIEDAVQSMPALSIHINTMRRVGTGTSGANKSGIRNILFYMFWMRTVIW